MAAWVGDDREQFGRRCGDLDGSAGLGWGPTSTMLTFMFFFLLGCSGLLLALLIECRAGFPVLRAGGVEAGGLHPEGIWDGVGPVPLGRVDGILAIDGRQVVGLLPAPQIRRAGQ